MIDLFRGQYFFLSNFFEAPIIYDDIIYGSSEAAFQAQKTLDISQRELFTELTPLKAKKRGEQLSLRSDWEKVKLDIMYEICKAKFTQHEELRQLLISTCGEMLIEGNDWGDTFWGVSGGIGENHLGKILMRIRDEI
ncbi:MAG: NADAR family protein [Oscillospiraceae bacterium]